MVDIIDLCLIQNLQFTTQRANTCRKNSNVLYDSGSVCLVVEEEEVVK